MTSDSEGGSVFGDNLWRVFLFGNALSDGSGTRVQEQEILLVSPNSNRGVLAGVQTTLSDIATTWSMLGLTCSQMPYICVEIQKNPSSNPDFTLTGDLMDCIQLPCRGMIIRM